MAHGIYIGMTGAAARARQLDQIADNLANAQTPGFKATQAAFESFVPSGRPGVVNRDDYAATATVRGGVDMRPGTVQVTGRPLDVLPKDNRFLGVLTDSGELAYTRDGRMQVASDGTLMTAGRPVVDEGGSPIIVPEGAVPQVGADGRLTAFGGRVFLGRLGLFALQGGVDKVGPSTVVPAQDGAVEQVPGEVDAGQIELANYSTLDAAVQLVTAQRSFEQATQAIEAYRSLDEIAASKVGSVS